MCQKFERAFKKKKKLFTFYRNIRGRLNAAKRATGALILGFIWILVRMCTSLHLRGSPPCWLSVHRAPRRAWRSGRRWRSRCIPHRPPPGTPHGSRSHRRTHRSESSHSTGPAGSRSWGRWRPVFDWSRTCSCLRSRFVNGKGEFVERAHTEGRTPSCASPAAQTKVCCVWDGSWTLSKRNHTLLFSHPFHTTGFCRIRNVSYRLVLFGFCFFVCFPNFSAKF